MKKVLLVFYLFVCISGYSQEFYKINGKTIDKKHSTIVPFASVYIKNTSIGTISNQDGFFEINIPKDHLQNNIILSSIGYESQTIDILKLEDKSNNIFYLEPIYYQMDEVVIKPIRNIEDTVLRAYKLATKNYDLSNYELDGFFRHYVKHEGKYDRFIESALKIQNMKYINTRDNDTTKGLNIKLVATRKSEDISGDINTFISPSMILRTLIPYFPTDNYMFKLTDISYFEGNQVYIVKFEPKPNIKTKKARYEGVLMIDAKELAFIEINYSLTLDFLKSISGGIWAKHEGRYHRFYRNYTYDHKKRQFQKLNGKWYLKYTNLDFGVNLSLEKKNIEWVGEMYSELLINDIKETNFKVFARSEVIDPKIDLFSIEAEYNEGFWDNYNELVKTQKVKNIIKEINNRKK